MRLGLDMDAVDETHMMRFHSTIVQEDCMAIGISISGRTEEVMECLKQATPAGSLYGTADSQRPPGIQ